MITHGLGERLNVSYSEKLPLPVLLQKRRSSTLIGVKAPEGIHTGYGFPLPFRFLLNALEKSTELILYLCNSRTTSPSQPQENGRAVGKMIQQIQVVVFLSLLLPKKFKSASTISIVPDVSFISSFLL